MQGQIWSCHTNQLLSFKGVLDQAIMATPDLCAEVTYEPPSAGVADSFGSGPTPPIIPSSPLTHDHVVSDPVSVPHDNSIKTRYPSRVRKLQNDWN